MRLYSNKESVVKGEVSILAIVETFLAVALVLYLSTHFNTLRWLGLAMCVAPLLLLRTEESTRLGIKWINPIFEEVMRRKAWLDDFRGHKGTSKLLSVFARFLVRFCGNVIVGAVWMVSLPVVRIIATVAASVKHPVVAVQAIPNNWSCMTLAMDTVRPPELIPDHPTVTLGWWLKTPINEMGMHRLLRYVGRAILITLTCLPACIYRWSLKATSIIYTPLIFIVRWTFRQVPNLRQQLEMIRRSDIARVLAVYALVFIGLFIIKVVLMNKLSGFAPWWHGHPVLQFLALYVAPTEIPKWQFVSFINSVLALGGMLFVRAALVRIEVGAPWPEIWVTRLLNFSGAVRRVLAFYTISCTVYITMRAARDWNWPALGTKWFPW